MQLYRLSKVDFITFFAVYTSDICEKTLKLYFSLIIRLVISLLCSTLHLNNKYGEYLDVIKRTLLSP